MIMLKIGKENFIEVLRKYVDQAKEMAECVDPAYDDTLIDLDAVSISIHSTIYPPHRTHSSSAVFAPSENHLKSRF